MARRRPWRSPGLANERRSEAEPGRTSNGPPTARAGSSEAQPRRTSNGPPTARARLADPIMSILVDKSTRVVVQGITGKEGAFHAARCKEYGTTVVGGVTPGKGGTTHEGFAVWNTVEESVRAERADCALIFVPPMAAADAIMEAAAAGVSLVVCITEGIPVTDMVRAKQFVQGTSSRLIGPNCPGLITPDQAKIGIMPGHIHQTGHGGVVSRSGTLTYEVVGQLTSRGVGQSTCVGIGGDPVNGTSFVDVLGLFKDDPETRPVMVTRQIGGTAEEEAAAFIRARVKKPGVADRKSTL